mgnify:CR=1 FL=1
MAFFHLEIHCGDVYGACMDGVCMYVCMDVRIYGRGISITWLVT